MSKITNQPQEASTQTIDLYDDDPDHFGLLLKAMYTHRYDHTAVDKLAAGDKSRCIDIALGVYMLADKYDIALINRLLATQLHDILTTTKDENNVLLKATIAAYYKNPAANVDGEMGKMLASIVLGPRRAMRAINLCFLHRQVRRVCSKTVYVDRLCALEKVYLYVLYLVWQRYEHGELAGGRVVKPETIEGKCDSLEDKEVGRVTSR